MARVSGPCWVHGGNVDNWESLIYHFPALGSLCELPTDSNWASCLPSLSFCASHISCHFSAEFQCWLSLMFYSKYDYLFAILILLWEGIRCTISLVSHVEPIDFLTAIANNISWCYEQCVRGCSKTQDYTASNWWSQNLVPESLVQEFMFLIYTANSHSRIT